METILKSNSQDTQVSVLMINDKGIMLSVKGNTAVPFRNHRA